MGHVSLFLHVTHNSALGSTHLNTSHSSQSFPSFLQGKTLTNVALLEIPGTSETVRGVSAFSGSVSAMPQSGFPLSIQELIISCSLWRLSVALQVPWFYIREHLPTLVRSSHQASRVPVCQLHVSRQSQARQRRVPGQPSEQPEHRADVALSLHPEEEAMQRYVLSQHCVTLALGRERHG